MASEVVLLTNGDARGESIVASFAQQTGLTIEPMEDGARFALHGSDHDIKVVETLTRIDPNWSGYLCAHLSLAVNLSPTPPMPL